MPHTVDTVWMEILEGANIGEFDENHSIANFSITNVLPYVKCL